MQLLAQIPGLTSAEPPPLPAGSALARYFVENPWPAVVVLLGCAAVAWYLGNRQNKARQGAMIAAALAVAAAGVFVLSRAVETTRERLVANTAALIDATARADTARLGPMLAGNCTATLYGSSVGAPFNKDTILSLVERYPGNLVRIKEYGVKETQATSDTVVTGRTQVRVVAVPAESVPTGSWWRIHWRRDADAAADDPLRGWRVSSIECLGIDGVQDPGVVR